MFMQMRNRSQKTVSSNNADELKTLTLKAGTIVHICGWPVELTTETVVASSAGNIELVTRDLYLRGTGTLEPQTGDQSSVQA